MLERIFDSVYLHELLTLPHNWACRPSYFPDDPDLAFVSLPEDDSLIALRVHGFGCFLAERFSDDCYEVHVLLRTEARGKAESLAREAIDWFYKQPFCTRDLLAYANKPLTRRLVTRLGFEQVPGYDYYCYTRRH